MLLISSIYNIYSQCNTNAQNFYTAKKYFYNSDYSKALNEINIFYSNNKTCDSALYFLALILNKTVVNEEECSYYNDTIISTLNKLIEMNPNFKEAYYERASRKMNSHYVVIYGTKTIIEDVDRALKLDSCYVDALLFYYTLFNASYVDEKFKIKTFEALSKVISIDSTISKAYAFRSHLYEKMEGEKDDLFYKALEDINNAIELEPDFNGYYHSRGILKIENGYIDEGCKDLNIWVEKGGVDLFNIEINKYCNGKK